MIWTKASPVGIDIPVTRYQNFLYPALKEVWGIQDDVSYDCHPRAYKNQTADGYIPEVFIGVGNDPEQPEYKEVFLDDSKSALSFFALGDLTRFNEGDTTAQMSLTFLVNVQLLKPNTAWRGDEEIRNDVEKLCQISRFGFELMEIVTGYDQVFKEYSGWRKKDGMKFRDMHPNHCFRLNFSTLYDINDCYQPLPNNF